ncbi:hypothetical protein JQC91_17120 [Jannaschia sp. Os4]|uniref:M56 family metallopeptidase n=1 Tax=Jannaschia sp. Os4 TaxID=2807617 RepID=UPI001939C6F5|nr:M56 family metallopeptidase [Jannaschia sp. Os4]MBM2578030.1 hypothetical protein [Jannaschia sp. Os4]
MAETLVEWTIAANAAVLLAAAALAIADRLAVASGRRRDWTLRSWLTSAAWALALALTLIWIAPLPRGGVNGTDLLVGQYLRGNLVVSASDLSALLAWRGALARELAALEQPLHAALAAVIVGAAILRAGAVALAAWRLRTLLAGARVLRRIGRVRILATGACAVPFAAAGPRARHAVLPEDLLRRPGEARLALTHELQHLRNRDPQREVLVALLSPLFAANPAFWWLVRHARRLREHGCDAACLARADVDARAYAISLLSASRRAAGAAAPKVLTAPLFRRAAPGAPGFLRSHLGRRVDAITRPPLARPLGGAGRIAAFALLCASVLLAGWMLRPPGDWSHERLMLSSVTNLERMAGGGLGQRPLR